jgi:hypothetical protein
VCWGCSAVIAPTVYYSPPVYYAPSPNSVLHHTIQTIIRPRLLRNPPLKHRARIWIRIVAAHGKVVAIRVLRAIPSRVVARVTVTETITEVVAKKNAAETEYGATPESTELPIEARIEVPTCEGTPTMTLVLNTGSPQIRTPDWASRERARAVADYEGMIGGMQRQYSSGGGRAAGFV